MMTKGRFALAASVLCVILPLALLCVGHHFRRHHEKGTGHAQEVMDMVPDGASTILREPKQMPISEEHKSSLKAIYECLVAAYSNGQFKVVEEWEDRLPLMVESLTDGDFKYVESGFYGVLAGELSGKRVPLRNFVDVKGLDERARTDLSAMKLYGKVCWRRRSYGDYACRLEALALRRLWNYREKFVAERRPEFIMKVDAFIEEWIDHIESPRGFSRAEALYWMEFSKMWGHDASGKSQTWEHLRDKAIAQGSEWLVRVGYHPKWADEFKRLPKSKVFNLPKEFWK